MANRYWVGGTGTWSTATTNWSAASALSFTGSRTGTALTTVGSPALVVGMTVWTAANVSMGTIVSGSGNSWVTSLSGTVASQTLKAATIGASAPTAADSVFFDANSSGTTAYTVTMTGVLTCLDITTSALTPTFATGTTPTLAISGSMSLVSGTVWSSTGAITFNATTAKTITSGVTSFSCNITFSGVAGSWALQDALTAGTANTVTLTNGTLDLNGKTLTCGLFSSNNANTRTIAFGTGNITVKSSGTVWNTDTVTNFTTSGTQVVNVSNTTATATTVTPGFLSEANSISFNFTTGSYTLTWTSGTQRNVDFTGYSGSVNNIVQTIYGNLKLSTGMTLPSTTGSMTFAATSGTKTITTNAKTINFPLIFDGVGGTWQLQDALTQGSSRNLNHVNGTIDLNGKTLTVGTQYSVSAGTKNLTFNAGTMVIVGFGPAFSNGAPTGFTTTAGTGTGTISLTSASSKTFTGGGSTYNCTLNQGGAGALTISGSNTFTNITNTVQPATITFTASTTNTFSSFSLSGTAGNLITINSSTAGTQATVSKSSGTVNVSYCSIQDSAATGGATWNALTANGNVNVSNNTGWVFSAGTYTITALNGTYAVAGQTITILRDKLITANAGSYSITGQSAVLQRTKLITANYGTYAVSGQTITITRSKLITANYGNYAVTGQSATLARSKLITANYGSYSITGQSSIITRSKLITASAGSYAVTGQSATLTKGRVINASTGSYAVNGQDITISFGRLLSAQNGVYSVTGEAVNITVGVSPTPLTAIDYFIWIRSFTERRRI